MVSKVISAAPIGYAAELIEVEGDASKGLPSLQIVGMGNKAIDEAKERVRSAIRNSDIDFPAKKITINLAPAEIPKDGTYFDLPIAISILIISNQLRQTDIKDTAFIGELSLDGELRPIKGILNIIEKLKLSGVKKVILPQANAPQAALIDEIEIIAAKNLRDIFLHLKKEKIIEGFSLENSIQQARAQSTPYLDEVIGQDQAKRALTIAIAGHHNILLTGPPGTGKTMLAQVALGLLPDLSKAEILEVAKIHGLVEDLSDKEINRPFRSPHHTASKTSIIGGGPKALPGEISLAHLGILFLDEMPEYPRSILESLRQPLEDRKITVNRTNRKSTYPANFMLVATMNPCPCGFLGDSKKACSCSTSQIVNYQRKISGPLLDRIDIIVNVNRIDNKSIFTNNLKHEHIEHSKVKKTIKTSLKLQHKRFNSSEIYNSMMKSADVPKLANLTPEAQNLLNTAADKLDISVRGYLKIIKVARTIADLENSGNITPAHISEALQYRSRNDSLINS